MKKILFAIIIIMTGNPALAADKEHLMTVHGAVCPSCAYGLEKKFMKIDGVKAFDLDFTSGIVSICAEETLNFEEEELTKIFSESGYSYKGEEIKEHCELQQDDENDKS